MSPSTQERAHVEVVGGRPVCGGAGLWIWSENGCRLSAGSGTAERQGEEEERTTEEPPSFPREAGRRKM